MGRRWDVGKDIGIALEAAGLDIRVVARGYLGLFRAGLAPVSAIVIPACALAAGARGVIPLPLLVLLAIPLATVSVLLAWFCGLSELRDRRIARNERAIAWLRRDKRHGYRVGPAARILRRDGEQPAQQRGMPKW